MIYTIITCSIINNERIAQYKLCINNYIMALKLNKINSKIIVIENSGKKNTPLDLSDSDVEIFYTKVNSLEYEKGTKEICDIIESINYFNINDDDLIIKLTGRYFINMYSEFLTIIKNEICNNRKNYDCILRYGSFNSKIYEKNDCVTGLIGIRCRYLKQLKELRIKKELNMKKTDVINPIEHDWAEIINKNINVDKICELKKLNLYICPGKNDYFLI